MVCFVAGRKVTARQSSRMLGIECGERDRRPHHYLDAGNTKVEDRRDRDDDPRHREHHREEIASDHPAAVLHDVAVAHAALSR